MEAPTRVLIVEDEVIVAMELKSLMEQFGYEVTDTVTTGADAIGAARNGLPDLVLMDVRLDGPLDGVETADQIRQEQDLPIVFLTAYSDEVTLSRAKATEPLGYVVKPFEERDLYTTIEVVLNKHRLQRRLQESHDDLLEILDSLRLGTAMTDADGHITFLSRAAQRLLGRSPDRVEGRPWHEAFPFGEVVTSALRNLLEAAADAPADRHGERAKVPATVETASGARHRVEIEVRPDPRNAARHVFTFYDVTEVYDLRRMLKGKAQFQGIIGKSAPMQRVFEQIRQVAQVGSTAVIYGETGTGKELVARAIHDAGHRSKKSFVAVNCAALSKDLAASQLFGHKRGAFTGAVDDHRGFFEAADGGTLFLDEIGDVPLDVQVKLLRVLEERTITRLGETKPRNVDVRILVATHRDLREEVEKGRFREDLLYRIHVARVELPPLRHRRADIPLLTHAFMEEARAITGKRVEEISYEAMHRLIDYDWPGNVRELRNAVEHALIRAQGPVLQSGDLPSEVRAVDAPALDLPNDEKARILAALEQTDDNRKEAAKLLGISRATFYRRLNEHGID